MQREDFTFISGAFNETEVAFLEAAQYLGLKTKGFMATGCQTENNKHPEYLEKYNLIETFGGKKQMDILNLDLANSLVIFLPPTEVKNKNNDHNHECWKRILSLIHCARTGRYQPVLLNLPDSNVMELNDNSIDVKLSETFQEEQKLLEQLNLTKKMNSTDPEINKFRKILSIKERELIETNQRLTELTKLIKLTEINKNHQDGDLSNLEKQFEFYFLNHLNEKIKKLTNQIDKTKGLLNEKLTQEIELQAKYDFVKFNLKKERMNIISARMEFFEKDFLQKTIVKSKKSKKSEKVLIFDSERDRKPVIVFYGLSQKNLKSYQKQFNNFLMKHRIGEIMIAGPSKEIYPEIDVLVQELMLNVIGNLISPDKNW